VQAALAKILSAIYEPEFLNNSFGFRPNRGCHDAIRALNDVLFYKPINYVADIDILGFFEHIDHDWMIKFLEHRIQDPNIIRLIKRFLKSGVMENGVRQETIISNIYLHYVIDLWFEKRIRRQTRGEAYMVRYADDNIFCFQYEDEANVFYKDLADRLKKFGLEISEEKSKIIAFGRNVGKKDKDDEGLGGRGKPETFDFEARVYSTSQDSTNIKIILNNPWKPVTVGILGIIQCYTILFCYICQNSEHLGTLMLKGLRIAKGLLRISGCRSEVRFC